MTRRVCPRCHKKMWSRLSDTPCLRCRRKAGEKSTPKKPHVWFTKKIAEPTPPKKQKKHRKDKD